MLNDLDSLLTESERKNMIRNTKTLTNPISMFKIDIVKVFKKKETLKDIFKCKKLQKKHKLQDFKSI
jgi:CBS-domain-containing membrane protein|tara:strand:+ start:558 stop:758 length:201 start_codon:yes stop_codon:yes gene_type:complete